MTEGYSCLEQLTIRHSRKCGAIGVLDHSLALCGIKFYSTNDANPEKKGAAESAMGFATRINTVLPNRDHRMPISRNPKGGKTGFGAVTRTSELKQDQLRPQALNVDQDNFQETASQRYHSLTQIACCLNTLSEISGAKSVDPSLSEQDHERLQANIDNLLAEISQLCEELPCFDAHEILPPGLPTVDPRVLSASHSALSLEVLGIGTGIRIRPTYRDLIKPVEKSSFDTLEAALEGESNPEQGDQIRVASERYEYICSISKVFVQALDTLAIRNANQDPAFIIPSVFSAISLAEEINKVTSSVADHLSCDDIITLAGGNENVDNFISRVKAVVPAIERARLVNKAICRVGNELLKLSALLEQLQVQYLPTSDLTNHVSEAASVEELTCHLRSTQGDQHPISSAQAEQEMLDYKNSLDIQR